MEANPEYNDVRDVIAVYGGIHFVDEWMIL